MKCQSHQTAPRIYNLALFAINLHFTYVSFNIKMYNVFLEVYYSYLFICLRKYILFTPLLYILNRLEEITVFVN